MRILSVLMVAALGGLQICCADGVAVKVDTSKDRWEYESELAQNALISYKDGKEKLTIDIALRPGAGDSSFWLFPVPAAPKAIALDILKDTPSLHGQDLAKSTTDNFTTSYLLMAASQLWTVPGLLYVSGFGMAGAAGVGSRPRVEVAQHLEKDDLVTEVVSTKTVADLATYLRGKGLKVDPSQFPALQSYIGKDYAFVVSWMNLSERTRMSDQILAASFRYDQHKPHSPLLSAIVADWESTNPGFRGLSRGMLDDLGGQQLVTKALAQVHADPSLAQSPEFLAEVRAGQDGIEKLLQQEASKPLLEGMEGEASQLVDDRGVTVIFPTEDLVFPLKPTRVYSSTVVPANVRVVGLVSPEIFADIAPYTKVAYCHTNRDDEDGRPLQSRETGPGFDYTSIQIHAPSTAFTQDLWIHRRAPLRASILRLVNGAPWPVGLCLMAISSVLASWITGAIVFGGFRKNWRPFALLGLCNMVTIVGVATTLWHFRFLPKRPEAEAIVAELGAKGYVARRRLASLAPLGGLIALPVFGALLGGFSFQLVAATVAGILVFASSVKPEDRVSMHQLASMGYSTWTFQPTDRRALWYLAGFSASFLGVAFLVTHLVLACL